MIEIASEEEEKECERLEWLEQAISDLERAMKELQLQLEQQVRAEVGTAQAILENGNALLAQMTARHG